MDHGLAGVLILPNYHAPCPLDAQDLLGWLSCACGFGYNTMATMILDPVPADWISSLHFVPMASRILFGIFMDQRITPYPFFVKGINGVKMVLWLMPKRRRLLRFWSDCPCLGYCFSAGHDRRETGSYSASMFCRVGKLATVC